MSESESYIRSAARMGTVVTIRVVGDAAKAQGKGSIEERVARAIAWFDRVEEACSRFDEKSELRELSRQIGVAVHVSPILFEAVQFALQVAGETAGAFDPTIGHTMEKNGFNRHYRSGEISPTLPANRSQAADYREVRVDPRSRTVTLCRPLLLDLGAVAKGLAIDLAAKELEPLENFLIDAGGDLFLAGTNAHGEPWSVGIRHPRNPEENIHTATVSNAAVCTSGDYEKKSAEPGVHHLLDGRTGRPAGLVASATVVAPTAMMADALATAAFALGPVDGIRYLEQCEVEGLIVSPSLEQFTTTGFPDE